MSAQPLAGVMGPSQPMNVVPLAWAAGSGIAIVGAEVGGTVGGTPPWVTLGLALIAFTGSIATALIARPRRRRQADEDGDDEEIKTVSIRTHERVVSRKDRQIGQLQQELADLRRELRGRTDL